jgi:hypothetical protein
MGRDKDSTALIVIHFAKGFRNPDKSVRHVRFNILRPVADSVAHLVITIEERLVSKTLTIAYVVIRGRRSGLAAWVDT